jgi:hypothetical protein
VAEREEIYKQPDMSTLKKVLKEKGVRKDLKDLLKDIKGFGSIGEEVGDMSLKRKRREGNDEAISMIEKIAGLK